MNDGIIHCQNLSKSYHDGNAYVEVLKDLDFTLQNGDRVAIIGPSGSGKSTLLHLLGGLDQATSGDIFIEGISWQAMSEKKRCMLRNKQLGFIYQFHHLLPEFSALENVALPLLLAGMPVLEAQAHAHGMLDDVGLTARVLHKPSQLSGGERQRVAIARALVHKPRCVFADEPTGNLDQSTASNVFDLMLELNKQQQTALVIVTHDKQLASRMEKVMRLQEGRLSLV